jgi:hypothetical protein
MTKKRIIFAETEQGKIHHEMKMSWSFKCKQLNMIEYVQYIRRLDDAILETSAHIGTKEYAIYGLLESADSETNADFSTPRKLQIEISKGI